MLDSGAFFLSADYQFYIFDWRRLRKGKVGTVVLPNQVLQLLRPFIPRSEDFDRRFVETFAIPEVRGLSAGSAAAATKVLGYLNTYRDLDEGTAVRMLTNEVLLGDLKEVEEGSQKFQEMIESALAKDNALLIEERESAAQEAKRAANEAKEKAAEAHRMSELAGAAEDKVREEVSKRKVAEKEAAQERLRSEEAIAEEEARRRSVEAAKERELREIKNAYNVVLKSARGTRVSFGIFVGIVLALGILFLPSITSWQWLSDHPNRLGLYGCALLINAALTWAFIDPARRSTSLSLVGLGALLVMIQLLGG